MHILFYKQTVCKGSTKTGTVLLDINRESNGHSGSN